MSLGFLVPGLLILLVSTASGRVRWRLSPMAMVKLLSSIAAISASTVLLVLVAAAAGFAAQLPGVAQFIELCRLFPRQHDVGIVEGGVASVLVAVIAVRAWRVLQYRRRAVEGTQGRRFAILDTDEPIAYAAPGDPGCVVVSRGLLADLGPAEREVVLAHERAHLHHKHHRYLLVGELSLAALPLLGRLVNQLRLATERSADESAVAAVGDDRRLVAMTIARAAVMTSAFPSTVGSFGGGSVVTRVEALLAPATLRRSTWTGLLAATAVISVALVASSAQAHHLLVLIRHICQL